MRLNQHPAEPMKPTVTRPMHSDELEAASGVPAVATNRVFLIKGPAWVRLAFGEQVRADCPTYIRGATILSDDDATALAYGLLEMLHGQQFGESITIASPLSAAPTAPTVAGRETLQ